MVKKKAWSLASFKETILPAPPDATLEADELFRFVLLKVHQTRIWIAQCRQIVSFFIGEGSLQSCKKRWRKLPMTTCGEIAFPTAGR